MKFILLTATRNSGSTSSSHENIGVSRGRNVGEHSDSTRPTGVGHNSSLNEYLHTRKSSNEHGLFIAVTPLSKISEGRIGDLTGDVLFPVAFKGAILTVTMKNPGHYWCVMSNKALMGTSNRVDPPRPWIGVLTSRVLANRTSKAGSNILP